MVKHADSEAEVPVATSNNEVTVTIAANPFLPCEETVRLKTMDGDVIKWDAGDGKEMTITLEDGTELKVCIYCTECNATNVYPAPEILDGLGNFETAIGMETRRHRSLFYSTSSRSDSDYYFLNGLEISM